MLIDIENRNPHVDADRVRPEPVYSTKDSAGFDIPTPEDFSLVTAIPKVVKTGLYIKQPRRFGFWWFVRKTLKFFGVVPMLEIRPRSGLAVKGVGVANAPGTVDADYPEEIGVILVSNVGPRMFARNERIAQGVVTLAFRAGGEVKTKKAERKSGFGSTGK